MGDCGVGRVRPHLDRIAIRPGIRGVGSVLADSFGISGRWLRPAVAGQALIRPRGAPRRSSRDASSRSRRAAPGCARPAPCVGIGSRIRRRDPRARASCRPSRETRARSIPRQARPPGSAPGCRRSLGRGRAHPPATPRTGSEKAPSRQALVIAEVPGELGRLDIAGHGVRLAADFTGCHGPAPALRH